MNPFLDGLLYWVIIVAAVAIGMVLVRLDDWDDLD